MEREESQEKTKVSNSRWETDDDGKQHYIFDTVVVIPSDKRCLGLRSARGYYNGPNQCTQRAVQKTGGHLCKKCFDEAIEAILNVKSQFYNTYIIESGHEGVDEIWNQAVMGVVAADYPDTAPRQYQYGNTKELTQWYIVFDIEEYLISVGRVSPNQWAEYANSARKTRIEQEDATINGLCGGYGYSRRGQTNYEELLEELDVVVRLTALNKQVIEIDNDWNFVPNSHAVKSITSFSAETGEIDIVMTDEDHSWNDNYKDAIREWANTWKDRIYGEASRMTIEDIDNVIDILRLYLEKEKKWDAFVEETSNKMSAIQSDISDRIFPWETSEDIKIFEVSTDAS